MANFMSSQSIILVIIGMALVTYLPRMIPLVYLADKKLPAWLNEWLGYIPVTVLSALLLPILFVNDYSENIFTNIYLLAAIPSFAIAYLSRNIFATVLVGMGSVVLMRIFLG